MKNSEPRSLFISAVNGKGEKSFEVRFNEEPYIEQIARFATNLKRTRIKVRTVKEMIEETGQYSLTNQDMEWLGRLGCCKHHYKKIIAPKLAKVNFDNPIKILDAIDKIYQGGVQPADLIELLGVVELFPEEQKRSYLIVHGTGFTAFPAVGVIVHPAVGVNDNGDKIMVNVLASTEWDPKWHFLVRIVPGDRRDYKDYFKDVL